MRPDACPTPDELAAFNLGDLPEPELDAIGEHLEGCFRCEARVRRMDHQIDPVIASIRRTAAAVGGRGIRRVDAPHPPGVGVGEAPAAPSGEPPSPKVPGYEVGELLGEGGMGVVYKARHLLLNRVVALKMIARQSNRTSARFRIEAEAAARLQHPNIVQIFEIGEHDGRPFLVLEYIGGGALDEELAGKPQPPRRAAELLRTLALAADHAHRQGIVHRDLKPSNILITPDGIPKITDFGIAKRLESDERWSLDGDIMGTPRYMAPEQASGRADDVGPATDVYSLGVILYEMLTGRVPHQAATSFETLTLVCEQEPVPPRRLQPRLPRDLETIVLACLRKDPARRYPGAKELADDLDRFLTGKPIQARAVGQAERAYKWARRHPTATCLVAAALLGLTAFSLASWRVNSTLHWYNDQLMTAARLAEQEAERAESAKESAQFNAEAESEQRRRAESALYFSRIGLADSEWRNNNVAVADLALDEYLPRPGGPDLRGWEWRYLKRLCHADLLTLPGHGNWVHRAAYSADGSRIVAAAGLPYQARTTTHLERPGALKVWDAASGRLIAEFEKDRGAIWDVDCSADGRWIASARADGTVCLWEADTFRCTILRQGQDNRSPDITQPSVRLQVQPTSNITIRFSPDGRFLAIGDARTLSLWDLDRPQQPRILREGRNFHFLAFSPDGKRLAVGGRDNTAEIIDLEMGGTLRAFGEAQDGIRGVAYSPDGKRLATSSLGGLVLIWDAESGALLHRLRGHDGESTSVAFSPDGRYLASGGADQTVRVWDARVGEERLIFRGHTFGIRSVAFSPDGERIVSAGQEGVVKVWDVTRDPRGLWFQQPLAGGQWVGNLGFSGDHARVIRVDHDEGLIATWDSAIGTLEAARPIEITGQYVCPRGDSALSPDGLLLAAPDREDGRAIRVWDVPSGKTSQTFRGHAEAPVAIAFSPDGERIASIGKGPKNEVKVWSVASGEAMASWAIPKLAVKHVAFGPGGELLATAHMDGSVRIWEAGSGREIRRMTGHRGPVNDVVFSPDGSQLASVGHADATLRLWDAATGRELFALHGHNHALTGVAYSPDGRLVASVGFEGIVKLWDTETGRDVLNLRGLGPRRPADTAYNARVAFSRDGTRIASNGWDGRINVWDASELTSSAKAAERVAAHKRAFAWHIREADPTIGPRDGREFGDGFHLGRIVGVEPPDEALRLDRARLFIRLGRWKEADADLARVSRPGASGAAELRSAQACLRLLAGDPDGYRAACATLVADYGGTDDPAIASLAARACLAGDRSGVEPAQALRWAQLAQSAAGMPSRGLGLVGAARYRAGEWDRARRDLAKAAGLDPEWDGRGVNQLLLAMACWRLGDAEVARKWLAMGRPEGEGSVADPPPLPRDIHDLLAYRILLREAEGLLTAGADPPPR